MHVRKPLLRAAAPMGLLAVLAPASLAQTTWIYTSNNPTTAPPIVRDYASDTLIPSDPMAPGTFLGLSAPTCLGPVTDPSKYEGGVAVDRTSSTVISTDGQRFAGGGGTTIQLEFQPTTPGSCTPGVTSCQIVKGAMPSSMIEDVIGIDIEYWRNPLTGFDEPYRLWVATPFRYTWIWLTKNNPTGQRPRWHNQAWTNPFIVGMHDIAFGHITPYPGGVPGTRTPALFAVGLGGFVYVWDPIANTAIHSFPSNVQNPLVGITIDTSFPKQGTLPPGVKVFGVSGRILLLEDNYPNTDRIWDLTTAPFNNWFVGGPTGLSHPYKAGMASSQELVSLGVPCGSCGGGPGVPGSTPSTAVADVQWSLAGGLPGQPITKVTLGPPNATAFRIEACGVPVTGAGVTPYLVLEKGAFGPAATSCLAVDPTVSTILPGNAMLDPTRYYADVNVGTLPSVPGSAIPFNTQHVYFGQWVFMCGTGTPFNPTGAPFMASDPFRIAVSNPH